MTAFVKMGLARLDRPHRELDRCLRDLADAVRARDLEMVRGRACLLVEKLGAHFADEEEMTRLPELIRFHMIATDFGCAKHVVRVARDPAPGPARHGRSPT